MHSGLPQPKPTESKGSQTADEGPTCGIDFRMDRTDNCDARFSEFLMRRSQPHKTAKRSASIHQLLNMYALAASAAGVGALALAQPAEGKIIYTKANKVIGPKTTFHIDVNHDGIADFDLKDTLTTFSTGGARAAVSALPDRQKNAIWGHTVHAKGYASALFKNVQVGPKGRFLGGAGLMAQSSASGGRLDIYSCTGPWANVANRYLGLKFVIKGKTHFGWARLSVSCSNIQVTATLTGYAYESIANRPILTGKEHGTIGLDDAIPTGDSSTTLGRLAQGAKGGRRKSGMTDRR